MKIFYSGDKNPPVCTPERVLGKKADVMTSFGTVALDGRGMKRFLVLVKLRAKRK